MDEKNNNLDFSINKRACIINTLQLKDGRNIFWD